VAASRGGVDGQSHRYVDHLVLGDLSVLSCAADEFTEDAIEPEVGTLDSNGKFTPVLPTIHNFVSGPQRTRTLSIADIRNGRYWLQLTFHNGGGREIKIDQVGIVGGNDSFFNDSDIPPSSVTCAYSPIAALGCFGSIPFRVKPSDNQIVYYPLFAAADFLVGADQGQDEELRVHYGSFDAIDRGSKPTDTVVKITP
jgi:hypothetical protein